jgi:hypothetical protein
MVVVVVVATHFKRERKRGKAATSHTVISARLMMEHEEKDKFIRVMRTTQMISFGISLKCLKI